MFVLAAGPSCVELLADHSDMRQLPSVDMIDLLPVETYRQDSYICIDYIRD
jgi:hypothetical protein